MANRAATTRLIDPDGGTRAGTAPPANGVVGERSPGGTSFPASVRNVRMMHLLERIARAFNDAGVPVLALKGAALNLVLYDRPDERPMGDLDLLIKPENVEDAFAILEKLGCLRGEPLVREDFFPRFHYEVEFRAGDIYPVKIDLHVRPFRPLRSTRASFRLTPCGNEPSPCAPAGQRC